MKKEERLKALESKINEAMNELWEILPETPRIKDWYVINTQDRVINNLRYAAAHVRDLTNRFSPVEKKESPKPKPSITIKKFTEIDAKKVAGKMDWEMEACFELLRAAENSEGQICLVNNNGMFDDNVETFEVGISFYDTGDYKNHVFKNREEAEAVFESYL